MNHIKLIQGKKKKSLWRKNSLAVWGVKDDSSTYVYHKLNIEKLLVSIKNSNLNIKFFPIMLKILSHSLKDNPEINVILRNNSVQYRDSQNIFIHCVEDEAGEELSGMVVYDLISKKASDLTDEVALKLEEIRNGKSFFEFSQSLSRFVPIFLLRPLLKISGFLMYNLNLNLSPKIVPKDCFGSIMVSNIGSIGLQEACIPLVNYTHTHLAMALGSIQEELILSEDNLVQKSRFVRLGFTFDHRVIDGIHLSKFIKSIESYIKNCEQFFNKVE